jgi:hypothetical protein
MKPTVEQIQNAVQEWVTENFEGPDGQLAQLLAEYIHSRLFSELEWPRVFHAGDYTWIMESEDIGKHYIDYKYKEPSTMSCTEFSSPELHGQGRLDVLRKIEEVNKPEAHGTPFHESTQPGREWPVYTKDVVGDGVYCWTSEKICQIVTSGFEMDISIRSWDYSDTLTAWLNKGENCKQIEITEAEARSITGPKERKVLGYRYTGVCLPYDACPDDCYYTDMNAVTLLQKRGGRPTEWCYLMKKIEKPAKKYWSMKESMGQYWLANEGGELVAMSPREDIMRVIVDKLNGTP